MGRILLQNPNGMGMRKQSIKQDRLKSCMLKNEFGIVGLSEIGVNWNRVEQKNDWWSRTNGWFKAIRSAKSFNTTDPEMGRAQAGGTITMVRDRFAFCTDRLSHDVRNLGRWSSIRLQGKGAIKTRIVTVYCACKSSILTGYSTYNQQLRTLAKSNIHECPREVFWKDLIADLDTWRNAGEQLVVMGDWNHPIEVVREKLQHLGLDDAIKSIHPDMHSPATHNRGSSTIDGIFISSSLVASAGGYCMFNKILLSDHRALWIDIPLVYLLGFEMPNIVTPSARRLKIDDPKTEAKYYAYLKPYLLNHNIYNRIAVLLAATVYPLPAHLAKEYESIHAICKKGMIAAEKQCRQIYSGAHPWSATFSIAQDTIVYWTLMCQKVTGKKVDTKKILRLRKRLGLLLDPDLSISTAYREKDRAWDVYIETKKNSCDLRQDFLEYLATVQAEASNIPRETILRNLKRREDQRRAALAIKKVTDRLHSGGISRVLYTNDKNETVEITERLPMEKKIADTHEVKYHSSESCSLLQGQLFNDIGILGFGPKTADILNGTYQCPPGTPRGARLFLNQMKKPDLKHQVPHHTMASFKNRWKKTKESTSSAGPLHFGHYKSGCKDDMIGWLLYSLAEIPFISGYSPKDWQNGIDVVILKAINDYRIEKMRTIVLYSPEFNMNNKRLGWEAMNVAISNGQLAVEQYSRPGRSSIDHVVNRQLSFNYFVLTRQPFGVCSCDLTGCYDRVVHSAISLAMQRLGFKPGAIKSQFSTIQNLIHKIRTVFGDSHISYGGNTWKDFYLRPPQGFGQGNCFGPPGWAILSSTIFAVLKDQGYGVHFCQALSKEVFILCGFAYVDDADLIQTGRDAKQVSQRLQAALSIWEDVIQATGGAMAPAKSWWYSIDIIWKRGVFQLIDGGSEDLIAHDEDGNEISLQRLACSEATKMLGVYLSPDGNHVKQLEYMKKKAQVWADFIRAGHLSPADSWVAISTTIWKTLEYPLAALMLTEKEIDSLVWPIVEIALPKMGMTRNIAKAVRYGPLSVGGVGLRNLFLVMGLARIQYLVEHPWKHTPTGNLIEANWESFTMEAGILGSLFDANIPELTSWLLTPTTWVRSTLNFIHSQKISLSYSPFIVLHPKRLRDSSIMKGLARIISSPACLRRLNQCRIFLRVICVSDISNAAGTAISGSLFGSSGKQPYRSFRKNSFKWPQQQVPPPSDWTLWRESIKSAFCATNWDLRTRLGHWTISQDEYFNDWDYFIDVESHALFANNGSSWRKFKPYTTSKHNRIAKYLFSCSSSPKPPTTNLRRTSIISSSSVTFQVEAFPTIEQTIQPWVPSPILPTAVKDRLLHHLTQCKEYTWLATCFEISDSVDLLIEDWKLGQLCTVSDGSYNPDVKAGAAAWSVESLDGSQFIRGGGRTAGLSTSQGAYRSEVAGLLGLSMCIWAIEQTIGKDEAPEIVTGCDGISALYKCIQKDKERLRTKDVHFDMISAVIGFWSNMKSVPFPTHVKGHQDDGMHFDSLPRLAQMNVIMDKLAKDILSTSLSLNQPHPTPAYTFGLPIISCDGIRIESKLVKNTVELISTRKTRAYWKEKWNIPQDTELNWDTFGKAFKLLAFNRKNFVRKWISDTLPVGTVMRKRKCGTDNRCPRCSWYNENILHILTCHDPATRLHKKALLEAAFNSLQDLDTAPYLLQALNAVLTRWLFKPSTFRLVLSDIDPSVQTFMSEQNNIGWMAFLCGFHPPSLLATQATHYKDTSSQKSPILWASKLTRIFWNFLHEMWDHRNSSKFQTNELPPDAPEITALRQACLSELNQGFDSLPPLYHRFFNVSSASLLEMPHLDLRNWFKSIRTFRESTSTSIVDVFSNNGPFRKWVGLAAHTQPALPPQGEGAVWV